MLFFVRIIACVFCVFFFKQKTAYEMRISDWSSDVCSSDLQAQEVEVVAKYRDQDRFAVVREKQRGLQPVDVVEIHIRMPPIAGTKVAQEGEIGRASCRERVCQYV